MSRIYICNKSWGIMFRREKNPARRDGLLAFKMLCGLGSLDVEKKAVPHFGSKNRKSSITSAFQSRSWNCHEQLVGWSQCSDYETGKALTSKVVPCCWNCLKRTKQSSPGSWTGQEASEGKPSLEGCAHAICSLSEELLHSEYILSNRSFPM